MVDSASASFMASWLTPSSLFLLLNLTIGTIFLITRFGTHKNPHDSPQLARSPSLFTDRVKSINFSLYKFDTPTAQAEEFHHLPPEPDLATEHPNHMENHNPIQIVRTPSFLERLKSINLSAIYRSEEPEPEADPDPSPEVHDRGAKRSKSESSSSSSFPGSASAAAKADKMTKSASEKLEKGCGEEYDEESGAGEEEREIAAVERRRPATARVEKKSRDSQTASSLEDVGVDAKADDFINNFKQQLRLQRLESLKRFSDMWKGK